jgi:hypothetical protein
MTLMSRRCASAVVAVVALAAAVAAPALSTSGKAGAPGQVCENLKVKGNKTDEQRAAFRKCIQEGVAKREADKAAKHADGDEVAKSGRAGTSGKAGAPGQVCKHLKVKGNKTDEQRAAFKECIQDAVAKRKG